MQVHGRLHSEFKLLYVLPYPVAVINGIDYIVSVFYAINYEFLMLIIA